MRRAPRLGLLVLALAGCGEERIALDGDAACQASACRVKADYGELGRREGAAQQIQDRLVWFGQVGDECGAPVVELSIALIDGRGAFAGGLATGRVALAGAELAPDTCGACVRLIVDDGRCYFAAGGELVLTSVDVILAGTLSEVPFTPVDCISGAALAAECTTEVAAMSFSETIDDDPE